MATQTQKAYGVSPIYVLQPDYQFSHNGYGLLQLAANFDFDVNQAGKSSESTFLRGDPFPSGNGPLSDALKDYTWTLIKAEEVGRDGNLARIKAMYAAIEKPFDVTQTEATITSAAVSEPIESHPNFSVIQIPAINDPSREGPQVPLGGKFVNNTPPFPKYTFDPNNPYRAYWSSGQSTIGIFPYQFNAFLPTTNNNEVNRKAGVKSWFRPSITMRLTSYTSDIQKASETAYMVGWIIDTDGYGIFSWPDVYSRIVSDDPIVSEKFGNKKNWLVTGTNVEVYGGLYKVTADLLLSGAIGWDPDIYPTYSQMG